LALGSYGIILANIFGKEMVRMTKNAMKYTLAGLGLAMLLAGCSGAEAATTDTTDAAPTNEAHVITETTAQVTELTGATGGQLSAEDLFTERDLTQTADTTDATYYTLEDGRDITIAAEGVYVIQGTAADATIYVDADDADKVQIVLDGATIVNDDAPAIYVRSADKVFVTTTSSENALSVTGSFVADGDTNLDAVIFSRSDLVLNGTGTLTVTSTANGISSKDGLKVTGGMLAIDCAGDGLEANDSVAVADGTITIATQKDGIHAEYDDGTGYVYITGGTISIQAASDGIQGTELVQIDGGTLTISAGEGIESTYVQINGGAIDIYATDDGINASFKSGSTVPMLEINGGDVTVSMAQGDTDALDSNGYLSINGGTVDISAQSAFDFDYSAELTGGTVYVNGSEVTSITNSMMMGGGMGGPGR